MADPAIGHRLSSANRSLERRDWPGCCGLLGCVCSGLAGCGCCGLAGWVCCGLVLGGGGCCRPPWVIWAAATSGHATKATATSAAFHPLSFDIVSASRCLHTHAERELAQQKWWQGEYQVICRPTRDEPAVATQQTGSAGMVVPATQNIRAGAPCPRESSPVGPIQPTDASERARHFCSLVTTATAATMTHRTRVNTQA